VSNPALDSGATLEHAAELRSLGRLEDAARVCRHLLEDEAQRFAALVFLTALERERGRDHAALSWIEQALERDPQSADALLQRAMVLRSLGRLEAALASYDLALAIDPRRADALYNRGNLLHSLGRHEDALANFDAALRIEPYDAAALNNRAVVLLELGRPAEALESCEAALALQPGYADALSNRGNALQRLGRLDEALVSYGEALRIEPGHAEARNNRGTAWQASGRSIEALADYAAAIAVRPEYAEAHNNRAAVLLELERPAEALASAERALAIDCSYAEALNNCGLALQRLGRCEEALACHERAFALRPDALKAASVGDALHALDRPEEALASYERALALDPRCIEALNNRGNALQALKRHREALASYVRATEIAPDDGHAHWNEALCRLALGDFECGWPKYEWRRRRKGAVPAPPGVNGAPLTAGAELAGRTMLVYTEQGHGDAIQFIRYVPLLAARGARVIVACHESLRSLFAGVEGVADTVTASGTPPPVDLHAPLLSLPMILGTTADSIPARVPYLRAPDGEIARWERELERYGTGLRVGLAWMGNPAFSAARAKSCGLARLAAVLEQVGCLFVSLQKGEAAADIARLGWTDRIIDRSAGLATFSDTAALIVNLDLVISIDTAVAHLAGALGKPVWILLQYVADWRWLMDGETSPWYPTARLFRQPRRRDWDSVSERVAEALAHREDRASATGARTAWP
jgi:tetratricopeptide (TPR) repeat protein